MYYLKLIILLNFLLANFKLWSNVLNPNCMVNKIGMISNLPNHIRNISIIFGSVAKLPFIMPVLNPTLPMVDVTSNNELIGSFV